MSLDTMTSANFDSMDQQGSHGAIALERPVIVDDRDSTAPPALIDARRAGRLRTLVVAHHALVWRSLRRFGVSPIRVDEAVSRVFDVLVRRVDDVELGREVAFLVQVCVRTASEFRRVDARRAQVEAGGAEHVENAPSPEELFEKHEERALLDRVLDAIEPDTRAVFVLHEIEQMTLAEIAAVLDIPLGTAKSRHRRGREQFDRAAEQLRRSLEPNERGGER